MLTGCSRKPQGRSEPKSKKHRRNSKRSVDAFIYRDDEVTKAAGEGFCRVFEMPVKPDVAWHRRSATWYMEPRRGLKTAAAASMASLLNPSPGGDTAKLRTPIDGWARCCPTKDSIKPSSHGILKCRSAAVPSYGLVPNVFNGQC